MSTKVEDVLRDWWHSSDIRLGMTASEMTKSLTEHLQAADMKIIHFTKTLRPPITFQETD